MVRKNNIIIDTDPGHDDALAIMLAIASNKFKIHAITTVAGNSTIENTTRNARFILKLMDREDIPVYSGSDKPLKRDLIKAVVHGKSGLEGIDPKNKPALTGDAIKRIISAVKNNPNKITIIALGPLTNIAKAIQKNPLVMSKLKEIVIMGGAIRVAGNQNRVAEFNIHADPEAADIVFRFPSKKTLVPLDACNHITLQLSDFDMLRGTKLHKPLKEMLSPYIKNIFSHLNVKGALVYDPLAVYSVLNPYVCDRERMDLIIEKNGEYTRGMVVPELRNGETKKINTTVIKKISKRAFKRDFFKYMKTLKTEQPK